MIEIRKHLFGDRYQGKGRKDRNILYLVLSGSYPKIPHPLHTHIYIVKIIELYYFTTAKF